MAKIMPARNVSSGIRFSPLEESEPADQMDLFALPGEPQRDAVPVHYAELAANPKPTERKGGKR